MDAGEVAEGYVVEAVVGVNDRLISYILCYKFYFCVRRHYLNSGGCPAHL